MTDITLSRSKVRDSVFKVIDGIQSFRGFDYSGGRLSLLGESLLRISPMDLLSERSRGYPRVKAALRTKWVYFDPSVGAYNLDEVINGVSPEDYLRDSSCALKEFSGSSVFLHDQVAFEVFTDGLVRYSVGSNAPLWVRSSTKGFLRALPSVGVPPVAIRSWMVRGYLVSEYSHGVLVVHGDQGGFIGSGDILGRLELDTVLSSEDHKDTVGGYEVNLALVKVLRDGLGKRRGFSYRDFTHGFDYFNGDYVEVGPRGKTIRALRRSRI